MSLRILHVFSPNFQNRFGGTTLRWRGNFDSWNEVSISHLVLDTNNCKVLPASQAFDFSYSNAQFRLSRLDRLKWIFELFRCLNQFKSKYDILHFHVLWWGALFAAFWAKIIGIPAVYESVLQESDTPVVIGRERMGHVKLWFLKKFTGIIAISEALSQDYLNSGFDPKKIFSLQNCLDTDLFHPPVNPDEKYLVRAKFGLPGNAYIFLFVGSMIVRKGVDLLIQSFIDLSIKYKDLFLWVIGPSKKFENPSINEDFVVDLREKLTQAHLNQCVLFSGLIQDRQVLADAYRAADAFVFPSRNEGLPNVVLEAMSSGLPVIISDLPGLKNITRSGENAWVVPIGDQKSLEGAIQHLLDHPDDTQKFSTAARDYIINNHSFSGWQSRLSEIYYQIWDCFLSQKS